MKPISKKDKIAVFISIAILGLFFFGGVFNLLDNFMIKALLILSVTALAVAITLTLLKDAEQTKSPED